MAINLGNINMLDVEEKLIQNKLPGFKSYNPLQDRQWLMNGSTPKSKSALEAYIQYMQDQHIENIGRQRKDASENNAEATDAGVPVNEDLPGAQVPTEESGGSGQFAFLEQLGNFKDDLQKNIKLITKKISDFTQKINDIIEKARTQSQKWINDKIQWVKDQYKKYHDIAQKWIDNMVDRIEKWVKKQIEAIKKALKKAAAYTAAGLIAMATKKPLNKKLVDKFVEIVPDPPIPEPSLPKIVIPLPELPIPTINIPPIKLPDVGAELNKAADKVISTADKALKGATSMAQNLMEEQVSELTGKLI